MCSTKPAYILASLAICALVSSPALFAAPSTGTAPPVRLKLRAGAFDPSTEKAPQLPLAAKNLPETPANLASSGGRHIFVQVSGPVTTRMQDDIRGTGATVVSYQPDLALIVKATSSQEKEIGSLPFVRWTGPIKPAWRVAPEILQALSPPYRAPEAVTLAAYPRETLRPLMAALARTAPGLEVLRGSDSATKVTIRFGKESPESLLQKILDYESVAWVETYVEPTLKNNESVWVVQSGVRVAGDVGTLEYPNSAPIWAHDILGTGQIVAVADSGLTDNDCFFRTAPTHQNVAAPGAVTVDSAARKVIAYNWFPGAADGDNANFNYHGSHVAGSVLGDNDANSSSATAANHNTGDGMAPNAKVFFQDIGAASTLAGIPNDLRDMFTQAYGTGARIHTNSWGAGVEGIYTTDSQAVDEYNFRLGEDMLILFAASNDGAGVNGNKLSGGENDTIGSPGTAKNALTVGALRSGGHASAAQNVVWYSSRGLTDDGRTKPDITAPGDNIFSHDGDATACNTQSMGGTSMATPTVAGAAALARQYFTEGWYPTGTKVPGDAFAPTAAALKAVLTAGARALTGNEEYCTSWNAISGTCATAATRAMGPSPNGVEGWGRITLIDSLWFSTAPNSSVKLKLWDVPNNAGVETGKTAEYSLPGVAAGTRLHINVVWSDAPGTLGAAKELVNDLNLEVVAPNGTTIYRGNQWAATGNQQPRESATGPAGWDDTNNIEGIQIAAPSPGDYLIRVHGNNVPGYDGTFQNRQGYAIAATGSFTQTCSLSASTGVSAVSSGANQIHVTWNAVAGATRYAVYRSLRGQGTCSTGMAQIGQTSGTSFTDTGLVGGYQYTYYVKTLSPCDGPASTCATATATGTCALKPTFSGIGSAASAATATCAVDLSWSAATSNCPNGSSIAYNIYRSTTPNFTASAGNRIATCVSALTYRDSGLTSGTTYHYIVRAEDGTSGNGGPCAGGNEESNNVVASGTPYGSGTGASGTWTDGGGDTSAQLIRTGDWSIVSTTDSASYVHSGTYAYKSSPGTSNYTSNSCTTISTPTLTVGTANPVVTFWERHAVELNWDAVIVQYSVNGGAWTVATAGTTATMDDAAAVGLCGFAKGTQGYEGDGGTATTLTAWASRSFTITAAVGSTVAVRWYLASDGAVDELGFVLDDISITRIALPTACTACTPPSAPSGVTAAASGISSINVSWDAVAGASEYRVYRSGGACPGGSYTQVGTVTAPSTSFSDSGLNCGTAYSYKVTSFSTCESAQSGCSDTTSLVPGVPSLNPAATPAPNTIRLTWSAGSPTGTSYNVYRSSGACPGGTFTLVASGLASATYDDTDLPAGGTSYAYKVSSSGPGCESAQSACQTGTPTGGPLLYSLGTFAAGTPRNTSSGQPVRWIYSSSATAMNPPSINSAVYVAGNDRVFHSMERTASGGMWPRTAPKDWHPLVMNAPAQGRTAVYTLAIQYPLEPSRTTARVAFIASQDGRVYCVDADNGSLVWTSGVLGEMLQGMPGIYARQFDSSGSKLLLDLIIVGTRNSASGNSVHALNAATGGIVWSFDNGGGADAIGIISGTFIVNQEQKLAYFASRKQPTGSQRTLWSIRFGGTGASPTVEWSADAGDVDGSPSSRGGVIYVGNNTGTVSAWDAIPGTSSPSAKWSFPTSNGPVKEMVYPDFSNQRLYFSTTDRVWCLVDQTNSASEAWSTPQSGAGSIPRPSRPLPYLDTAWIGSSDGNVYKISGIRTLTGTPAPVSIGALGAGSAGPPSIDAPSNLIHVGSESGNLFAVTP